MVILGHEVCLERIRQAEESLQSLGLAQDRPKEHNRTIS
jgi:hypothetical protein